MEDCKYYHHEDYYETDCGNQIEDEVFKSIEPVFCPFCGGKIKVEE